MYIYFFEFDVCVGVTAASAVVTEERETQIRFLTHHRITPLPINVNNSRRRRSCVLYTHGARRTYLRRKKTNKRIQIEYSLRNTYSKFEKLFLTPVHLYSTYICITTKTKFILVLHLNNNYSTQTI